MGAMHGMDGRAQEAIRRIVASYERLAATNRRDANLDAIAAEWAGLVDSMQELVGAIGSGGSDDVSQRILAHARRYLKSYDFAHELDTMGGLYAQDPDRLQNMGQKIAGSLEERGMMVLFGDVCNA